MKTIIEQEVKTKVSGTGIYLLEPTYQDIGGGVIILGQYQSKYDRSGNVLSFDHFDIELVRWC